MKVIELCGKAGVGKDTFGLELKKQLEEKGFKCIHVAFADRLKDICKHYFGWNGEKDEAGRHILQYIGTETFRNYYEDYWVNEVGNLLSVCDSCEMFDFAIITDARYPNEIEVLKNDFQLDVSAFRIQRPNFESGLTKSAQAHSSEIALDNYPLTTLLLSGDIKKLPEEVSSFIKDWRLTENWKS